jgi:hypothetical protein
MAFVALLGLPYREWLPCVVWASRLLVGFRACAELAVTTLAYVGHMDVPLLAFVLCLDRLPNGLRYRYGSVMNLACARSLGIATVLACVRHLGSRGSSGLRETDGEPHSGWLASALWTPQRLWLSLVRWEPVRSMASVA